MEVSEMSPKTMFYYVAAQYVRAYGELPGFAYMQDQTSCTREQWLEWGREFRVQCTNKVDEGVYEMKGGS